MLETNSRKRAGLQTATERLLAAIWSEVLPIQEPPDGEDDFFELGGDSVTMLTVLFRITEELSVELPAHAIFNAPALRELAALIDSESQARLVSTVAPVTPGVD